MIQSYKAAAWRDRVAAFLMCELRLERRGDVVPMDPLVMEEMLENLFECWDASTAGPGIVVSPDLRRVRVQKSESLTWENVMSIDPTDDYTVSISGSRGAPFVGSLHIGFTTRDAFEPCILGLDYHSGDGMYVLRCGTGTLFGSGKNFTHHYCIGVNYSTLRCVADRGRGTIEFYEDGDYRGAAWTGVTSAPLYAFVMFRAPDINVEFV